MQFDAEQALQNIARLDTGDLNAALHTLVDEGVDQVPLPAHGNTLARWRILAAVAARDLSLAKLFEGHTDALAILAELGGADGDRSWTWGVWCAEPADARLLLIDSHNGSNNVTLNGRKAWCSGAQIVSHAVVSCWNSTGQPCLATVQMDQPGVHVTNDGWHAVGMAGSGSVDVHFDNATATQVGPPNAYVSRPGFWHGGAGIAACWYGATCSLAERLRAQLHAVASVPASPPADPHKLSQLGDIDIALHSAKAALCIAARRIDENPQQNAMALALRTRLTVEAAATRVLALATRALGAGPLCREADFARMAADLPVFLRQSHAERDMATLGKAVAAGTENPWTL